MFASTVAPSPIPLRCNYPLSVPLAGKPAGWGLRCIRQTVSCVHAFARVCVHACVCTPCPTPVAPQCTLHCTTCFFFFFNSTTLQWFSQPTHRDTPQPQTGTEPPPAPGWGDSRWAAMPPATGRLGLSGISRLIVLLGLTVHDPAARAESLSGEDPRRGISGSLSCRLSI